MYYFFFSFISLHTHNFVLLLLIYFYSVLSKFIWLIFTMNPHVISVSSIEQCVSDASAWEYKEMHFAGKIRYVRMFARSLVRRNLFTNSRERERGILPIFTFLHFTYKMISRQYIVYIIFSHSARLRDFFSDLTSKHERNWGKNEKERLKASSVRRRSVVVTLKPVSSGPPSAQGVLDLHGARPRSAREMPRHIKRM